MELTPNEIRNQQFSSSMRGYNKAEVDTFRDAAATALEEAKVEILKLSEEKVVMTQKYEDLKALEETIKMAVLEGQRGAENILANARREAELIVAEARRTRDDALDRRKRQLAETEAKLSEIEFARRSLYARMRAEVTVHQKLLESLDPGKPENEVKDRPRPEGTDMDIDRIVEQFKLETGAGQEGKNEHQP